jgi:LytS/YehU family sensor histidine kinase
MQLNPHFLFNALNAVSALADDDPVAVRRIIARLSALLRRVLDSNATQEVSLRDELTSLRDYLSIQKIRFGDGLDVAEEIEPEALPALVPAFILQPLAENAVEHAAARRISGVALIVLRARYDQHAGRVIITVSDNGPGTDGVTASVQSEHTGIGLRNIRERLEAHYGAAASLTLRQSAEGGTDAEVTLPYQAGGHNNAMISNV